MKALKAYIKPFEASKRSRKIKIKVCVDYFSFFHQMIRLKQLQKMLFIRLKSSFHRRDIQKILFPSSPLFCLSAIALEYD